MKKILFIFTLCLITVVGNAALPYDWNTFFATGAINSDGTHLEANLTSPVLSWNVGATSTAANPSIQTNSLSYSDVNSVTYVDNTSGKQIVLNGGANVRNSVFYLSSTYYSTGTTFYLSALINVSAVSTTGTTFINFNNASNGSSAYGRVYIKQASGNAGFILSPGTGAVSTYTPTYNFNQTYLIVFKYVIADIINSQFAYLYVNPLFGSEGSPTITATQNTTSINGIKGLVVSQIAGLTANVSSLRLSTTWADAVKGKLSKPTVATGATSLTTSGCRANWTAVSNIASVSSYTVTVYNEGGSTNQTITGISSSATYTDITGLSAGSNYTYKVTAVGNGSNILNSDQSDAASFSTSGSSLTKLANPTSLANGSVTTTGFTASWTGVSNALNYDVKVYTSPGGLLVGINHNTSASPLTISGLTPNTAYTFTVTAKGDGTSYSDSDPASSTSFSTLALTKLSTPTVNATSAYSATGFTASWNTVANALSYNVNLYQNGVLVGGYPKNTSGQSTSAYAITGLTAGLSYTYTVTAIGDNSNAYSDSDPSSASSAYTSGTPTVAAFDRRSTGFTAGWSIPSSAPNYIVKLYQGGDLVSTTSSIALSGTGATASPSYIFTGLIQGLPYTYTVTTSDGFVSAESAIIITANPTILENFQDWAAVSAVAINFSKTLNDGTTGSFVSPSITVVPNQSVGSIGGAMGNSRPTLGRIQLSVTNAYIQLPVLQNVSSLTVKSYVGTAGTFKLQNSTDGSSFTDIAGTTTTLSTAVTAAYTFNLNYNTPKYLRIVSNQGSAVYFNDLQVNPYVSASKLTTPTVGTATTPSSYGFTANWTTVSNATGYVVKLYQGSNVVNMFSVSGQSASNLLVSGLNYSTTYTYKVIAVGDVVNYASSDASTSSAEISTSAPISNISTDFGDGTWGSMYTSSSAPALGSYPVYSVNGWDLTHAFIQSGTSTGPKAEIHTNSLRLDKTSNSGVLYSPVVASVAQIEIHSSATASRQLIVEVSSNGGSYSTVGTITSTGSEQIDIFSVSATNAKFRFTDTSTGQYAIYQIITRSTNPSLLTPPTVGSAANTSSTGFTANWTPADVNASGYKVFVYNGSTLVSGFPVTASGQATTNKVITGLSANTTYIYKVVSVGDGDQSYSDSYTSAASSNVKTLLSTPIIGTASAITNSGFTAQWTSVTSASGYDISVYQGVSLVSTTNASGQAAASLVLAGLNANTAYTFTVIAKGDGSTTFDSSASSASAEFSTTTTSSTDYFRTKVTGNWNDASTWESSSDNSNWGIATIAPTSAATAISILTGNTVTTVANASASTLTINSGATITVNGGVHFSVSTSLSNSGTMNLLSDVINGTSTILTPTSLSGTGGTYNVQQYLGTARNWYISSPVSNAVAPSGYNYYKRDEAGASWTSTPFNTGDTFAAGIGYIALPGAGSATMTFTTQDGGSLNAGDVPVTLSWSGATAKGFNLIGNPYPSHLSWTKVFTDANNQLIEPTIWYRTNAGTTNSSGQWSFQTYNAFSGEGLLGGTEVIPPMQAFWVKAKTNGTLTLDNKLTHSHQSSNLLKIPAVANSVNQKLRLQITNGISLDETLIYFNSDANNNLDAYDSPKMTNGIASIPEIYTLATSSTEQLAINGMNSISTDTEIPLGFTTGQAGTFTIKASQISNFDPSVSIYLKDNNDLVNTPVQLSADAVYTFSSDITTNNTSRFVVIFKAPSIATGINQANNGNVWISTNANNQVVINGGGTVVIYNAIGQKLSAKNLTANTMVIETPLQSGVYMVAVTNAGKTLTQKVIIK